MCLSLNVMYVGLTQKGMLGESGDVLPESGSEVPLYFASGGMNCCAIFFFPSVAAAHCSRSNGTMVMIIIITIENRLANAVA